MLIDTHAHLNFDAYKNDTDDVIRRSLDNDTWVINVGSQYATSKRAVEIAQKYPEGVYAATGLHPIHAEEKFHYEKFKKLTESKKVVAVGEIGLDYKKEYAQFKEKQRSGLCQQLNLAKELNLPVIFHCRFAHDDLIKILKSETQSPRGVIHCFTGTWGQAEKYLEIGLYLGFNGIIFKLDTRAEAKGGEETSVSSTMDDIIKKTPLEKILIETDCPYLTPPQVEGRNEPLYVKYIAEKIAKIKNISYQEVAKATSKNAKKLFTRVSEGSKG